MQEMADIGNFFVVIMGFIWMIGVLVVEVDALLPLAYI